MAQNVAKTATSWMGKNETSVDEENKDELGFSRTVLRPYRVYGKKSRKIRVPEHLVSDPEDARVRFYSWWHNDRFIGLWGTFLGSECPSGSLPEEVRKEECGIRSVCGPENDRRTTIPCDCDEYLFPIESEPMFVSVHYNGSPVGFRLIPETHWTQMLLRTQPTRR
jgi:hypothetical protein